VPGFFSSVIQADDGKVALSALSANNLCRIGSAPQKNLLDLRKHCCAQTVATQKPIEHDECCPCLRLSEIMQLRGKFSGLSKSAMM
jgi:hypothetical protein